MTTAEVQGYLRQLSHRKDLSDNERLAIQFALDTIKTMLKVEPIITKANKEVNKRLKADHDRHNRADTDNNICDVKPADPNTGWQG